MITCRVSTHTARLKTTKPSRALSTTRSDIQFAPNAGSMKPEITAEATKPGQISHDGGRRRGFGWAPDSSLARRNRVRTALEKRSQRPLTTDPSNEPGYPMMSVSMTAEPPITAACVTVGIDSSIVRSVESTLGSAMPSAENRSPSSMSTTRCGVVQPENSPECSPSDHCMNIELGPPFTPGLVKALCTSHGVWPDSASSPSSSRLSS